MATPAADLANLLASFATVQAQMNLLSFPRAYVTNFNANSVSVFDTATNLVVAIVPVGTNPQDAVTFNLNGTRAYVANGGSNTVSVIDTATNTVVATVPVGAGANGVAVRWVNR